MEILVEANPSNLGSTIVVPGAAVVGPAVVAGGPVVVVVPSVEEQAATISATAATRTSANNRRTIREPYRGTRSLLLGVCLNIGQPGQDLGRVCRHVVGLVV